MYIRNHRGSKQNTCLPAHTRTHTGVYEVLPYPMYWVGFGVMKILIVGKLKILEVIKGKIKAKP